MLTIVVLTVVAAVQVECAPNQYWPGFSHVSSFISQPLKKPLQSAQINKGFSSRTKVHDPTEAQRTYEESLRMWLDQVMLTLNTAKSARFGARPSIGQPVVQTTTTTTELPVEIPQTEQVVVRETVEPMEQPIEQDPVFVEIEPTSEVMTPIVAEIDVAADDVVPSAIAEETIPTFAEQDTATVLEITPKVAPEPAVVIPSVEPMIEPFVEGTVVEPFAEVPVTAAVGEQVMEPTEEIAVEPIVEPFVEHAVDEPIVEIQPEIEPQPFVEPFVNEPAAELHQPTAEPELATLAFSTSRSFSSAASRNSVRAIHQVPAITHKEFPGASFHPSVLKPSQQESRLPAHIADAVNTEGLAYTLQFFPTRGQSHYFVSTAIGGNGRV
ncbi:cytadherence high molecular weight protein 1 [Cherax quadricarinatus]